MGRPKGAKDKKPRASYTVSEKARAQRRNNTALPVARTEEEFDYNSRMIEHIMRIQEIASHADRSDVSTLVSCFLAYVRLCQEDGFSVGNIAAYSSMGFPSMQHFEMWKKSRMDRPEVQQLVTLVKSTCAMSREAHIAENKLNPVIGIFWQRNFDGLRNDTEQVQSAQEQDDNTGSKSYREKYKNLIGDGKND